MSPGRQVHCSHTARLLQALRRGLGVQRTWGFSVDSLGGRQTSDAKSTLPAPYTRVSLNLENEAVFSPLRNSRSFSLCFKRTRPQLTPSGPKELSPRKNVCHRTTWVSTEHSLSSKEGHITSALRYQWGISQASGYCPQAASSTVPIILSF